MLLILKWFYFSLRLMKDFLKVIKIIEVLILVIRIFKDINGIDFSKGVNIVEKDDS